MVSSALRSHRAERSLEPRADVVSVSRRLQRTLTTLEAPFVREERRAQSVVVSVSAPEQRTAARRIFLRTSIAIFWSTVGAGATSYGLVGMMVTGFDRSDATLLVVGLLLAIVSNRLYSHYASREARLYEDVLPAVGSVGYR